MAASFGIKADNTQKPVNNTTDWLMTVYDITTWKGGTQNPLLITVAIPEYLYRWPDTDLKI